jgi:PAS domain S-box-containing protein
VVFTDITERKRHEEAIRASEERQAFLLQVSDALRPLQDAEAIQATATALLLRHFAAGWCYFVEWDDAEMVGVVLRDATREGLPSLAGVHDVSDVPEFLAFLRSGQALIVHDYASYELLSPRIRNRYTNLGFRSMVGVPLVKDGQLVALLLVGDTEPREWSAVDVSVVEEMAERTWATLERARAEARLRASEERYRTLFTSIDQGFCTIEVLFDAEEEPVDYVFLTTNPAFATTTGLTDAVGKRMRALAPDHEAHWFEIYGRIAQTRIPERFEAEAAALGSWYNVFAFPVGEPEQRQVGILFENITERKHAEERQAFFLRLDDALRSLSDPIAIQSTASRLLGEHLRTDRSYYVEFDLTRQVAVIHRDYVRGDAPSLVGTWPFALFDFFASMDELARGVPIVVEDVATNAATRSAVAAYGAVAVQAYMLVPLRKAGDLVDGMIVTQAEPRQWTADELALLQEVAERTWAAVERARTEAALRESEERYRRIVDQASDYAIFSTDAERRIETWPPGAAAVFGWTAEEAVGQLMDITFTPADRTAGVPEQEFAEARTTGRAPNVRWHVRKDGTYVFIEGDTYARQSEQGEFQGVFKIGQDLTARKATEDALRQSEATLATVLRAAPVGIGFFDANGELVLANQAMGYYLSSGIMPSRDPGRAARWDAHDPEGRPIDPHEYPGARALRGLMTVPGLEMQYRDEDDRVVWVRVTTFPLRDDQEQVTGHITVVTDIDELKRAMETLRESESRLQQRVQEATVELRTLSRRLLLVQEEERRRLALELHDEVGQVLTGLIFQLAAAQGNNPAALADANRTVQMLTEQVRQLALELRPQVLDRYGLLAAIQWYVERYQTTTGMTVHLREQGVVRRRFPPEVEIAAFRVVQEALTNIARHAGVEEAWVTLFNAGSLVVVIHDQGQGFDPDQQRESIGLSGMRERVELLGGRFDVETAPGEGVHLTAEFPLEDAQVGHPHELEEGLR